MTVLLIIATILFFLTLDWAVRRGKEPKRVPAMSGRETALPVRIPGGIFFARNHTWLNLFPSGKVRLGIDDFIGRLLDRPSVVFLKQEGESIARGEPIIQLKQNGHHFTVRSPLSGTVLAQNEELRTHPEKMKEMLFSDGWAYTVQPTNTTELRRCLFGAESGEWIRKEFGRLRDVLAGVADGGHASPVLLQDGGVPVAGFMKEAPQQLWDAIEQTFLIEEMKGER